MNQASTWLPNYMLKDWKMNQASTLLPNYMLKERVDNLYNITT